MSRKATRFGGGDDKRVSDKFGKIMEDGDEEGGRKKRRGKRDFGDDEEEMDDVERRSGPMPRESTLFFREQEENINKPPEPVNGLERQMPRVRNVSDKQQEKIYLEYLSDPEKNTIRALSQKHKFTIEQIYGSIVLKRLEKEMIAAGEITKEGTDEFVEHMEECMTIEEEGKEEDGAVEPMKLPKYPKYITASDMEPSSEEFNKMIASAYSRTFDLSTLRRKEYIQKPLESGEIVSHNSASSNERFKTLITKKQINGEKQSFVREKDGSMRQLSPQAMEALGPRLPLKWISKRAT